MEQIDTNKEVLSTAAKKEIPFWNRLSGGGLMLFGIILIIVWYITYLVPRQECANEISYHPAGTDIVKSGLGYSVQVTTNTEGYYSHGYDKFKTKTEAVSRCMSEQK